MSKKIYDYLVIGGGSGGIASARRAAMFNKQVAVFEEKELGGTCVNVGCVPKKLMFRVLDQVHSMEVMGKFKSNWFKNGQWLTHDNLVMRLQSLKIDRDNYIKRLNGIYQRNLDNSGVDHIKGRARFLDNNTLECDGKTYQAEHIWIATGSTPFMLDIPGSEHAITSDGFFELEETPKRTLVIGGGYIATELSQILTALGSEVTIMMRSRLLSLFDQELVSYLSANLDHYGIESEWGEAKRIDKKSNGTYTVTFLDDTSQEYDCVLMAVGRHSNVDGLDLNNTDIDLHPNKVIKTDEYQNTTADGVYAVGDVDGRVALTPVAIRAGRTVAERIFNNRPELKVNYTNVPSVIFSHPPIGTVGLSEKKAAEIYGEDNIQVYKTEFNSKKSI